MPLLGRRTIERVRLPRPIGPLSSGGRCCRSGGSLLHKKCVAKSPCLYVLLGWGLFVTVPYPRPASSPLHLAITVRSANDVADAMPMVDMQRGAVSIEHRAAISVAMGDVGVPR